MGTSTTIVGQDATTPPDDPYFQQREADLARFAQRESGNRNITQASGGPASGYYQMEDSSRGGSGTWEQAAKWAGLPLKPDGTYGRAMDYSRDDQHAAAVALYDRRGAQPWAMSAPGARGQMASTDTSTDTSTTDPSVLNTPALATTPDQLRQALGLLGTSVGGGDNSKLSWAAKIGNAVGGGSGNLSGKDAEDAGTRSLMNFGMGLLANSGYHPIRTTMGDALAAGLQGAQASELGSQQLQRDTVQKALGYLQEQQGMGIKQGMLSVAQQEARIKAQQMAIEIAKLRAIQGIPNPLAGGSTTTTTATAPATPPVTTGAAPTAPSDVSALPVPPIPPEGGPPAATATTPDGTPISKGSPIPAGKLLKSDAGSGGAQVAADVAAMQQGQQLAQGDPGAPTARTAGPGAPTGGITPAQQAVIDKIQPQPGWAGATTTTPATTTPAPAPTTMATTPPTLKGPLDVKSLEEYRQAHPFTPSPQMQATFSTQPDPAQLANLDKQAQMAKYALSVAQATGDTAGITKASDAYNTAITAENTLRQNAQKEGNTNLLNAQKDWYDGLTTSYNKAQEIAQTGRQDIGKAQAQADINIAQKDIEERGTEATKAGTVIPILQQMSTQLQNLPKGAMGGLAATLDPNGILRGYLPRELGGDEQQATAAQMLQAARNYLSIELKPAATGSLRVPEMENLKSYTPGQLNTPQAQQEMIARLIAYQHRIQQEANFAGNYFGRDDPKNPGQRIYDNRGMLPAMNAPVKYDQNGTVTGGGLGPVVPEPPPLTAPDAEHQAYQNYVRKNVAPGMPYQTYEPKKNADGSFQLDANGKPIPQRVTKVQGYD
jgi:hypothetical protein